MASKTIVFVCHSSLRALLSCCCLTCLSCSLFGRAKLKYFKLFSPGAESRPLSFLKQLIKIQVGGGVFFSPRPSCFVARETVGEITGLWQTILAVFYTGDLQCRVTYFNSNLNQKPLLFMDFFLLIIQNKATARAQRLLESNFFPQIAFGHTYAHVTPLHRCVQLFFQMRFHCFFGAAAHDEPLCDQPFGLMFLHTFVSIWLEPTTVLLAYSVTKPPEFWLRCLLSEVQENITCL